MERLTTDNLVYPSPEYCIKANLSVSFIFPFLPECFQMGINNIEKNNRVHVRT